MSILPSTKTATAHALFERCLLCFSSCCMLAPSALKPESSSIYLCRCHCGPSRLRGPEGNWIVAFPCVVTALMRPVVVSQNSGFSKMRTAPTSGGFLIISKMSLCSRFLSIKVLGSLDACMTENLSLSGFCCFLSTWELPPP